MSQSDNVKSKPTDDSSRRFSRVRSSRTQASPSRLQVLTRRSDFLRTFRSGQKIRPSDWMIFNYCSSEAFRAGWTCPKAVGPAPIRNRMKRWTREWLRLRLKEAVANDVETPKIDLNVGFRAMPDDFFRKLKRAEFDQAMERGWNQLLVRATRSSKKPSPISPKISPS